MSWAAMQAVGSPEFPCSADGLDEVSVYAVAVTVAAVVNDGHRNEFYATYTWVAARCRLSRDTVRRVMLHLVGAGVLAEIDRPPGQATRYRWTWDPAAGQHPPAAEPRPTPRPDRDPPRPDRAPSTSEELSTSTSDQLPGLSGPGEPEHTPAQRAQAMMTAWWQFVESETGKAPVAMSAVQFKSLVTPFLTAGYSDVDVKRAVKALWRAGRPITKATIEHELTAPAKPRSRGKVVDALAEVEYGADGMIVS